ncbi:MAG: hypothetical protein AMXMBFR77_15310 [Phycisphaerales bacterium]|nr:flagellar biosynthesis anti-sigma factor FlgM [Phycisphaerales bacterium]MDL1905264.1 hypothetical protein [Synechococcales cyanobacterium CNB]GIK19180.1 MAG: hypothetical protein BroJett004_13440 [Planctomycetota bacterium]
MFNLVPVGGTQAGRSAEGVAAATGERARPPVEVSAPVRPGDQVEVSHLSVLMSRLRDMPKIRQNLVDRLRHEIETGAYPIAERLDAALDALLDDINPE